MVLHAQKAGFPPGRGVRLSPRLNHALVYTTVYLACRFDRYPKDLRDLLGADPRPGTLREIYRLYRLYKRELKLSIHQIDAWTFISSWIDGFRFTDFPIGAVDPRQARRLRSRAHSIAHRASGHASLRGASTKLIAAGAFTTALAEIAPAGGLSAFFRAVAHFLHMSETTIRSVAARIAGVLDSP